MLTHLSLFSGIGGIDLAAEWAGFTTVGQCEWADYPTQVLEKHWPTVPRWRDIRTLTGGDFYARTGLERPTLISGGFPCQPHSVAGKRLASADDRDLWSEYARVIRELRPKWVLAENVPGLLSSESGRFFGRVLRDLANLGYDVGWCVYGAADVGAPHRRNRVFIIAKLANADSDRWAPRRPEQQGQRRETALMRSGFMENSDSRRLSRQGICGQQSRGAASISASEAVGNAHDQRCQEHDIITVTGGPRQPAGRVAQDVANANRDGQQQPQGRERDQPGWSSDGSQSMADPNDTGCKAGQSCGNQRMSNRSSEDNCAAVEIYGNARSDGRHGAESRLGGVLAGISTRMDGHWPAGRGAEQYEWEPARIVPRGMSNRGHRLKALGNSVVPQQIYPILAAIAEIERSRHG